MAPPKQESQDRGRDSATLVGYALAVGALSLLVAWIAMKMTRTDQADFRLLVIAATMGAAALVGFAAWLPAYRSRKRRRGEQ